jgi:hypothetical protein
MGKMNIVLDDDTERKFREAVFKRMGMKKGNISIALEQAIEEWMAKPQPKVKTAE